MIRISILRIFSSAMLLSILPMSIFAQGSLTPPGTPVPTMKSLDQVASTGVNLFTSPTVDTTNANYHYIINQPGSYYLPANLGVTKPNGIQINAAPVTLDLNGFEISRGSGTGGTAISFTVTSHRATLRHGAIRGFTTAVSATTVNSVALRDLSVSVCSGTVVTATGNGWIVEDCRFYNNICVSVLEFGKGGAVSKCDFSFNNASNGHCANAGDGSLFEQCTASSNTASSVIFGGGQGCRYSNCSATSNNAFGIFGPGYGASLAGCTAGNNTCSSGVFIPASGATLINCSASSNTSQVCIFGTAAGTTLRDCSGYGNTAGSLFRIYENNTLIGCTAAYTSRATGSVSLYSGAGFYVLGKGANIQQCTAYTNDGSGFVLDGNSSASLITANNSSANGFDGFTSVGPNSLNRIDGNTAVGNNGYGFNWANDILIRNSSFTNTAGNYSPAAGTGNSGPVQNSATATNPFANF